MRVYQIIDVFQVKLEGKIKSMNIFHGYFSRAGILISIRHFVNHVHMIDKKMEPERFKIPKKKI